MIFCNPRLRPLRLLAPILIGVFLSGCTSLSEYFHNGLKVGPNYAKPAAPVAPQWIDERVRSETDDLSQWWKVFNDPVLDDLICHAYRQNLTLREAGFRVLQARALHGVTVGEFFPQSQGVSGGYTRTATSIAALTGGSFGPAFGGANAPPVNRYFGSLTTNFGLAWELDFWGRFRRSIEASGAELDASVENYDDVLVTLLGDVAANYVQLRVLQKQIALLHKNTEEQRKAVKNLQLKFDVGVKNMELDLPQAETTLNQTRAQIPQKEITLRLVSNRLCVLLGIPPEQLETRLIKRTEEGENKDQEKQSVITTPKVIGGGIPAELLGRRPDVRRAERIAAAESARIGVAVAQLYPHISINGTFGWQAPKLNTLFTPAAFQGSYGPTFQWDLLNYGRHVNQIRFQKAKFEEVVTAYQSKVLTAAEEVENGMAIFLKSQEQVTYLAESVKQAAKARNTGYDQYKIGKTDYNRVTLLELNLVQQQNLLAQAQGDVALGLIQIYRALGGGWQIRCDGACPTTAPVAPASPLPVEPDSDPSALCVRARFGQPIRESAADR